MSRVLYYPYINIPRTEWTLRTLLYYDNIGSIVPQEYFYNPDQNYDPFMLELVRNQLVTPINPIEVFENPWKVTRPFIQMVESNENLLRKYQKSFRDSHNSLEHRDKLVGSQIHADKFDQNVFSALEELSLAKKGKGNCFFVETKTANNLMKFLATIVSAKTQRLPITDHIRPYYSRSSFHNSNQKRATILRSLIPFPEDINLRKLREFKEKHFQLLSSFRTRVETIALNPNIIEGDPLFHQYLDELVQRKEELAAKMNESKFNSILFGTVCGLIGAGIGIAEKSTASALIGALPGFANAVYSALQIEQAESVFDQSGLKYLALADKRLRLKNIK